MAIYIERLGSFQKDKYATYQILAHTNKTSEMRLTVRA